ncbi:MAG: hypothetical protein ACLTSX_01760 [Collinsella sp.]
MWTESIADAFPARGALGARSAGCGDPRRRTRAAASPLPASSSTRRKRTGDASIFALEISVKVVGGIDEAIAHVNRYGTGHSGGDCRRG